MSQTRQQRLDALAKKEAQIKARKADLRAKIAKEDRRLRTRQLIIVGAAVLADAELHQETADMLSAILGRAITHDRDRDLLRPLFPFYSVKEAAAPSPAEPTPKTNGGFTVAAETSTLSPVVVSDPAEASPNNYAPVYQTSYS
jgi:hypothetical protein